MFTDEGNSASSSFDRLREQIIAANAALAIARTATAQRKATRAALSAVMAFCTNNEFTSLPLIFLTDALIQLDRGETPSLLQRRKRTGRPRLSILAGRLRGSAAVVVRELQRLGDSAVDARLQVAAVLNSEDVRQFGDAGPKRRNARITERHIRKWCEDAAQIETSIEAETQRRTPSIPADEMGGVEQLRRFWLDRYLPSAARLVPKKPTNPSS